jgi:hypothetical protein
VREHGDRECHRLDQRAFIEKDQAAFQRYSKDVDEVDHDRHGDAAAGGLGGHGLDLGVVPVDQDDPFPLVSGSRRSASSNAAAMTAWMSSVTEAVRHLPRASGSRGFWFFFGPWPALSSSAASAPGC